MVMGRIRFVIVQCFNYLVEEASISWRANKFVPHSKKALHTFFGGTIAIADFGVMEIWCGRESDLSPLTDRRNTCAENVRHHSDPDTRRLFGIGSTHLHFLQTKSV